ncbi:DNA polymerase III subunit alpha [Tepidibacillus sp. HK-1]|uniref:DNA polymerase III subunit alpha n=1 Tax=Tepidibacillus sp. HK-1 TaxID=1883407 RepID=UPI0008566ED1|nr:DNA polymerase III subunit alpha [Tepidibacillus sp. HK-1]GBF11765.1 DNA polymerase III subunit alpha [Tepidibacillus sp. HK-1]
MVEMVEFVHLHVHTEYSLLNGACRIEPLVNKAKDLGMTSLAITDHSGMYGVIPFYKACQTAGIKPIIGVEILVNGFPLVLLAENNLGYQHLMKLVSISHLESSSFQPTIDKKALQQYHEGIIALSGGLTSEISQYLVQQQYKKALETALEYQKLLGTDHFYLEIQNHGLPEQKQVNPLFIQLSEETGIPLVATNNVHYIEKEDALIQEVLEAIGAGHTLDQSEQAKLPTKEFYLKDQEKMNQLFATVKGAVENTVHIANRCDVTIEFHQLALPKFPLPSSIRAEEYLKALAQKGLQKRYKQITDQLQKRLMKELAVIEKMGFADYFLIVWDYMKFAHQQGIMTGPGRGSAAGSLVAYVLGITNVDPIKYGLLFERFLNPERVSMPDIDIDFNYERRDEVIQYVSKKYGHDRVAQIITFGTFAAKAAIRDVGRVLNIPYIEVDKVAKLIPSQLGITLEQALTEVDELRELYQKNERMRELIQIAMKIEGMPRHHSTHAAGVVIADQTLTVYTPLQKGQEKVSLTQYPMGILEQLGMLKMDFLGLKNLTIIEKTLAWIKKSRNKQIQLHHLDDSDPLTYQLLSQGHTKGVFQLESPGVTKVLKELKPSHFEDIVAILALYRPGPMESIPDYIQAKHGKKTVQYPDQSLEPILKDTYGIIVYQEQIMQIASKMAGFSLGEADLLRRAVSKKKREILLEERNHFVHGAIQNGIEEKKANEVYDLIVRFADYGFNRSHAVAYGVLAFQTAYLKAHYPVEFMTALLSESMGNQDKIAEYTDECRKMGIEILPPDLLQSDASFTVQDGKIRFGLAAIKNIGIQVIESIILLRQKHSTFSSLFDFCMKADSKVCNKKTLESLILSGALDRFGIHRAKLMANLDDLIERVQKKKKLQEDLQIHLFADLEVGTKEEDFDWFEVPPFLEQEQLQKEKAVLGIYVSAHPLSAFKEILNEYSTHSYDVLVQLSEGTSVVIGGLLNDLKLILTKKGQQMAFGQIEVDSNLLELVIFPKVYATYRNQLVKDEGILVQGKVQHQEHRTKLIVEKITLLSQVKEKRNIKKQSNHKHKTSPRMVIKISEANENSKTLNQLKQVLADNSGTIPVILFYEKNKKTRQLAKEYWVEGRPSLFQTIEEILGKNSFVMQEKL